MLLYNNQTPPPPPPPKHRLSHDPHLVAKQTSGSCEFFDISFFQLIFNTLYSISAFKNALKVYYCFWCLFFGFSSSFDTSSLAIRNLHSVCYASRWCFTIKNKSKNRNKPFYRVSHICLMVHPVRRWSVGKENCLDWILPPSAKYRLV